MSYALDSILINMPEEQTETDSPPAQEINADTYQKLKTSLEQGNYTTLECLPGEAKAMVDRLTGEFAETHTTMRVTVPEEGKDFPGVLSEFTSLAPEAARGAVRENFNATYNFSKLMEKTAQVNEKPVVAIIENLQHVTFARDDLIRVVRALFNERATSEDLRNLTFLLVADQHPSDLLQDTGGTPYNIGTNISLRD